MFTGLVTADPRKVCWKTYLYHGILMRCRVSCEPEPVFPFPINPVPPPRLCTYEADCMPGANVPSYVYRGSRNLGSHGLADGWYYFKSVDGFTGTYGAYIWWGLADCLLTQNKVAHIYHWNWYGVPHFTNSRYYDSAVGRYVVNYYSDVFIIIRHIGGVFDTMIMKETWKWNGSGWVVYEKKGTLNYTDYTSIELPFTYVPYIKYTYFPDIDKTEINVMDIVSCLYTGRYYAVGLNFELVQNRDPWGLAIDYERVVDLT